MSETVYCEGHIDGIADIGDLYGEPPRTVPLRMPCDRWFVKLLGQKSSLGDIMDGTTEMIDAVANGQADNPEARVVLSELRRKFSIAGAAFPVPVIDEDMGFYYGESASRFIRNGNKLYCENYDVGGDEYGTGKAIKLMMSGCDAKDVPLAALRSGFYSGIDDNRDWIKRAFEDLKSGKVSLVELRAALRDGCLNAIGRYHDGAGTMNADALKPMDRLRIDLQDGKEVRMHTKRGWPFGIKVPASSVELPNPVFNLDTIGLKIPGVRGAK